jgi:hypothetical protein
VGSESHFLSRCGGTCEGGLSCIGGICTRACLTGASDCSDLGAGAVCTSNSVEPGQVAVCDVPCAAPNDCQLLGSQYACAGAFCRSSSLAPDSSELPVSRDELCAEYLDQTPPPDVRGFSIVNSGTQVLYLQQSSQCGGQLEASPSLVLVERGLVPLNTLGGGCARSCQDAFEGSWIPSDGVGSGSPDCPGIDCVSVPNVAIQPGETLFQAAGREVVFRRMPSACTALAETDTVNCYSRVIPPRGEYTLTVKAFTISECSDLNESCVPLVFRFPSEFPLENQTLTIAAPE